jgi:hypothetical protein
MSVMVLKWEYWLHCTWILNQGVDALPSEQFNGLHFVFESMTDYFLIIIARLIVLADFMLFLVLTNTNGHVIVTDRMISKFLSQRY